jgi:cytidyltransferase-like protein
MKQYGLFIGRFQPFHLGHQAIINEIILDGKIPIIVIGDDNEADLKRNPLSYEQRKELIQLVYPSECLFVQSFDATDWTDWFTWTISKVAFLTPLETVTLYYHNKESDRYKFFEYGGKEYHNEFYTKIFEDYGIKMKSIEFVVRTDIHIKADATNLRESFEDFKHLLDGRVYQALKTLGWK